MKVPPAPAHRVLRANGAAAAVPVRGERDRSFVIFAGFVLAAIALSFKSELLAEGQVWVLGLALILLATPALYGYLRGADKLPAVEHYIPVALGAITLAGLANASVVPEWWKYALLAATFGAGFTISARLDYLRLRDAEKRGHVVVQEGILVLGLAGAYLVVVTAITNVILQLLWIFVITFFASYRSFRINGTALAPRRALIFSLFVGQVVTFLAWAVIALRSWLILTEGSFAVVLLFAWYINRGLVRHTVEESFTRHVVLEYMAFAAVLVYLFVSSYQNR